MCLLVVLAQIRSDLPLVVAANRDELLERPAEPMTVLRDANPRILGGRDELAGGTWLAVNQAGVVAGLTNRPTPDRRDPTKRSRGELPLLLARHHSAEAAVVAFESVVHPADYNPAWLLVGDRRSTFGIDVSGDGAPVVEALPPGVHILENRPLGEPSPKVDHVRRLLEGVDELAGTELVRRLQTVVADHEVPAGAIDVVGPNGESIPRTVRAACVHAERYGTRWSGIVTVAADTAARPQLVYADGHPCEATYADATRRWCADGVADRRAE